MSWRVSPKVDRWCHQAGNQYAEAFAPWCITCTFVRVCLTLPPAPLQLFEAQSLLLLKQHGIEDAFPSTEQKDLMQRCIFMYSKKLNDVHALRNRLLVAVRAMFEPTFKQEHRQVIMPSRKKHNSLLFDVFDKGELWSVACWRAQSAVNAAVTAAASACLHHHWICAELQCFTSTPSIAIGVS